MNIIVTGLIVLLATMSLETHAAPVIYKAEADFLLALQALGQPTIFENFENETVWGASRSSVTTPRSTGSVTHKGITWSSNYPGIPYNNGISTRTSNGNKSHYLYSSPHGNKIDSNIALCNNPVGALPLPCYQNDGILIQSTQAGKLYAVGGFIDANVGVNPTSKVTFLLDGVDIYASASDPNNDQRMGATIDNWSFFGVIDAAGFYNAELRELEGKDLEPVSIFMDNFTIAPTLVVPLPAAIWLFSSGAMVLAGVARRRQVLPACN
jgi:hypothetical protein